MKNIYLFPKKSLDFALGYNVTGGLMIFFPVLAFGITQITGDSSRLIFFVEWFGIWSFAVYWLIKSWELEEKGAERRALEKDPKVLPSQGSQQ